MMKRLLFTLLALNVTIAFAAKEKTRVAVLDLQSKNASPELALAVSDYIRVEMVKYGTYELLDRDNMNVILKEQAFQQSGCTSAECAVEIGQILNCQYMFVGSLSKLGDAFFISMQRVNIETGRVDFADTREVEKEGVLPKAARDLAGQMAAGKVKKKKVWTEAGRPWRIEAGGIRASFGEQQLFLDGVEKGEEVVSSGYGGVIGFRYCPGWRSPYTVGANIFAIMTSAENEYVINSVSHKGRNYRVRYLAKPDPVIGFEARLYYDLSDRFGAKPHTLKVVAGLGAQIMAVELAVMLIDLDPQAVMSDSDGGGNQTWYYSTAMPVYETLGIALSKYKLELLLALRILNSDFYTEKVGGGDEYSSNPDVADFPLAVRGFRMPAKKQIFLSLTFLM